MSLFARHPLYFWSIGSVIAAYLAWRMLGNPLQSNAPTASDVAGQGTALPGSTIYADTAGSVGYGVPGQSLSAAIYANPALANTNALYASIMQNLLNSGPNSTAPSSVGPVATVANSAATGNTISNTSLLGAATTGATYA
jgi:hypothetical protein